MENGIMDKIRVLLAEDHTIVRKGLRSLLDAEPDTEVVGEAEDGRKAIQLVEKLCPDVVLMDISMPGLNGLEATRQITKRFPEVKVLILTVHSDEEYIRQVLSAGASGYLVKQAAPSELASAIRAAYQGDFFPSPSISRELIEDYTRQAEAMSENDSLLALTDREREVLQLIAEGHSNRQIAEILHISVKTVETHRAHLTDKLGIRSAAELTKYALRRGVISLDE